MHEQDTAGNSASSDLNSQIMAIGKSSSRRTRVLMDAEGETPASCEPLPHVTHLAPAPKEAARPFRLPVLEADRQKKRRSRAGAPEKVPLSQLEGGEPLCSLLLPKDGPSNPIRAESGVAMGYGG
jgi:hypothetical protein